MSIQKVIIQRGRRASAAQKGALLSYLEDNINFAHERFECDAGVNTQQQKWSDLSNKLNSMGGAMKSGEQWKQYWRDFKRNVKGKAAEEKRQIEESGINGMWKIKSLDDFERRAISIISIDIVDGDGRSQEIGFNLKTVAYQDIVESNASVPASHIQPSCTEINKETSTSNICNTTPRPRRRGTARFNERRRMNNENEIGQYLEQEKEKTKLKREIFEFQKNIETDKLVVENKKADALVSISESLRDLKNIMQINNRINP